MFADESQEQHPHLDCAVEDDNDLIIAPPNSERPSANSTLPTSRPGSERTSSSVSYTSTDDSEAGQNQKDSLMAQGQEDTKEAWWTDWSKQWDDKATHSTERCFNLDEPRRYFQTHLDSVLLAQQRIFKAGGVSPGRVMHRDSVSITRKRMREKNAAQLAARDTPREAQVVFERLRPIADTSPPNGRKTTIQHRRSLLNQLKAIGISESWNEGTSFERLWLGMRHAWSGGRGLSCG